MDLDESDIINGGGVADAHIIKLISQDNKSISTGTIISLSLCDGKMMGNLLALMKISVSIYLQCTEDGFQFIGKQFDKQTNNQSDEKYRTVFYLTFKKDNVAEYFFCPKNVGIDIPGGKNSLTFLLSMNQISTLLKKTKMKATTILRFYLNGQTNIFNMEIIGGSTVIPYTLAHTSHEPTPHTTPPPPAPTTIQPPFQLNT